MTKTNASFFFFLVLVGRHSRNSATSWMERGRALTINFSPRNFASFTRISAAFFPATDSGNARCRSRDRKFRFDRNRFSNNFPFLSIQGRNLCSTRSPRFRFIDVGIALYFSIEDRKFTREMGARVQRNTVKVSILRGMIELWIGCVLDERSRLLNWKLPTSVLGFIFKQRIVADDCTSTHRLFGDGEKEKETRRKLRGGERNNRIGKQERKREKRKNIRERNAASDLSGWYLKK